MSELIVAGLWTFAAGFLAGQRFIIPRKHRMTGGCDEALGEIADNLIFRSKVCGENVVTHTDFTLRRPGSEIRLRAMLAEPAQ